MKKLVQTGVPFLGTGLNPSLFDLGIFVANKKLQKYLLELIKILGTTTWQYLIFNLTIL